MSNGRFVVDTNLIISAMLFKNSVPQRAIGVVEVMGVLLLSQETADELEQVVRRSKFDKYLSLQSRLDFMEAVLKKAESVPITVTITDCRDPKDNKFLELAVSGSATHIISGDEDLLVLHPFREITILSPADFLRSIGGENN